MERDWKPEDSKWEEGEAFYLLEVPLKDTRLEHYVWMYQRPTYL